MSASLILIRDTLDDMPQSGTLLRRCEGSRRLHRMLAGESAAQDAQPRHGERSRLQLHFKLGGTENLPILSVNVLAVDSAS